MRDGGGSAARLLVGWVPALAALVAPVGTGCGSRAATLHDTLASGPATALPTGSSGAASTASCSTSGEEVFLLDDHGVLRSFAPPLMGSTPFRTIGQLGCRLSDGTPWAGAGNMTIDPAGTAWVTDVAGHLFEVDTADASCRPTGFVSGPSGFSKVGMAFVGDGAGGEALYFVDNTDGPGSTAGLGLAVVDPTTLRQMEIGNFDQSLRGRVAELAGTPDGLLFGFFPGPDSWFAGIDPGSAHILTSTPLPISLTWTGPTHITTAISRSDGLYYLYLANTSVAPFTDVREFDPSTGGTRLLRAQIGFDVTGAGTSPCAPASPSM